MRFPESKAFIFFHLVCICMLMFSSEKLQMNHRYRQKTEKNKLNMGKEGSQLRATFLQGKTWGGVPPSVYWENNFLNVTGTTGFSEGHSASHNYSFPSLAFFLVQLSWIIFQHRGAVLFHSGEFSIRTTLRCLLPFTYPPLSGASQMRPEPLSGFTVRWEERWRLQSTHSCKCILTPIAGGHLWECHRTTHHTLSISSRSLCRSQLSSQLPRTTFTAFPRCHGLFLNCSEFCTRALVSFCLWAELALLLMHTEHQNRPSSSFQSLEDAWV